ncbi:cAMP dependent protein kinase [Thelephora terrestris]|uniref:cAMP-dependent protein kinase n=1 Tax=Thelephora terrestris TaxID=56493 RepID=A0A9P6HR63_9AGAM|nr:cAMP dependent protein kinase [Thelephora terrestris]
MFSAPPPTSLPSVAPPLPSNGLSAFHPIARKDSLSIAPMTPPMSPTETESRMDVDHPAPHSRDSDVDHLSTQDSEIDLEPLQIHPPIRTLDESRECLPRSLRLTDFEVRGTLGAGTFGRVLLVRLRSPSHQTRSVNCFALKVLRKSEIVRLRQVEHVNAERNIMSRVRHPFIVDLYSTFQDSLNIYMLLSYVPGGELFTHLRRAQRFSPDVTRFYLATIVLALKYLHSFNIIYRDLKPENLLLDSRGYLRLTDFGFAKIVEDRTWTLCGTPEYLAPEIILNEGHGKPADWWACGVLAYEMMVGFPPFFDETAPGIYEKILRGRIYWPKEMDRLSKELVKDFLHPDRTKRLGNLIGGSQDVLDHPWFRGVDWDALERKEIRAPIVPHVSSLDDTRHFSHLPLPPAEDIPGLMRNEAVPVVDSLNYAFVDF